MEKVPENQDQQDAQSASQWLVAGILARLSGTARDAVHDSKPSRVLFVGSVEAPAAPDGRRRPAPSQVGMEFLLPKSSVEKASLKVVSSAAFYYRVFPTSAEQREASIDQSY